MIRVLGIALSFALPALAHDLDVAQLNRLSGADIVLLGEVHDNPEHHIGQADMITRIAPKAVVFEMLSDMQASQVNAGPRTDLTALGHRIGWQESGWPPFALYHPVFAALGDTPVVGAAAPRDLVRQAFSDGAAVAFGDGADVYGLTRPLAKDENKSRIQMQFEAHCEAMPMDMMPGMIEAQRLRDARFSAASLKALETFGAPIVVIAGNGHARRDWGMPAMIKLAAPDVVTFAIGFVEDPAPPDDTRFDVTIVTAPAVRDDPCAAFTK